MRTVGSAWLAMAAVGCGTSNDGQQVAPQVAQNAKHDSFAIEIHDQPIGVIYQYPDLVTAFEAGRGGTVRLRLDERDVASYVVGPAPSAIVGFELTPDASARWSTAIDGSSETLPFSVSIGSQRLFVGVLYPAMGAAAIDTPVLHVISRAGQVTASIGARQGASWTWRTATQAHADRIDRPELRAVFRERGTLAERPAPPSPAP